ncbi:MAG: crotonase/enoyl-CoA hydratase family protein [Acidimicrobiales bacterium]|jgi:enoyl-CoA hydratase
MSDPTETTGLGRAAAAGAAGGAAAAGAAPEEPVVRERHGHVELVRLNRERARNAIDGPMARALGAIFDELSEAPEVWAVVLTGTGDRAFCAGMDLKAFATGEVEDILSAKGGFAGIAARNFAKPLIGAVNGAALAGGFEIVLACDLVVAADHAVFGIPEVKRGLVAAGGGLIRLARRVPRAIALELALTGDSIDAQRALACGLVNRVVPGERLIEEALALAAVICANAPLAVRASKELMKRSLDLTEEEAWELNGELTTPVFTSSDAFEGVVAFAEGRPPVWTGTWAEDGSE